MLALEYDGISALWEISYCPAVDNVEERALFFLCDLLDPLRFDCEIVASAKLAAEIIAGCGGREPVMMVIAVLPPDGTARSCSLCKRLLARFAQLKILALCWQYASDQPQVRQSFLAADADSVSLIYLKHPRKLPISLAIRSR